MSRAMVRLGMLPLGLLMLATVGCSGDGKEDLPIQEMVTATASPAPTASPTPTATLVPDKIGMFLEQGKFDEALGEASRIRTLSERDAALKRVMETALKYGYLDLAYEAGRRMSELALKDQAMELVFSTAFARGYFSTAMQAATSMAEKRSQELLPELIKAAAERGDFRVALVAASNLRNPERDKLLKELVHAAAATGWEAKQIYPIALASGAGARTIVRAVQEEFPAWTIPQEGDRPR